MSIFLFEVPKDKETNGNISSWVK